MDIKIEEEKIEEAIIKKIKDLNPQELALKNLDELLEDCEKTIRK